MATADRIPRVIGQLQLDHRNRMRLLGLLGAELERRRDAHNPDFDLLGEILEYVLHYPDLCHHPKEMLIYRRMLCRDATVKKRIGNLLREHARLAELARHLAAALRNVAHDAEVPRQWLENLVESYIAANERHIAEEERSFFPLAMMTLSDADWDEIDSLETSDPLLGGQLADGFHRLHDRIMRLAV